MLRLTANTAMAINNPILFTANTVDYAPLENACAERGAAIRFTDSDMERERHSRWLRFEWKSPGVVVPLSQTINFEHLTALGLFTCVLVWGDCGAGIPTAYQIIGQMAAPRPCTLADLADLCVAWQAWADGQMAPQPAWLPDGTLAYRLPTPWIFQR